MELAEQGLRLDTTWTNQRQPEDGMSAEEAPKTHSLDLVQLLPPIWGAGLLLAFARRQELLAPSLIRPGAPDE